ncbi:MAG TPA: hypothetical protein VK988_09635 [Acidimicrobiales bacterium]|nr:hypothetical protein [Acidimicrobiales bacterium]
MIRGASYSYAMELRVAEQVMRSGLVGRRRRYRVDLHGVSVFGPGDGHTLIRWERIETIAGRADDGVRVESATAAVVFPRGAFGLDPPALAAQLEAARSIDRRGQIIAELAGG